MSHPDWIGMENGIPGVIVDSLPAGDRNSIMYYYLEFSVQWLVDGGLSYSRSTAPPPQLRDQITAAENFSFNHHHNQIRWCSGRIIIS